MFKNLAKLSKILGAGSKTPALPPEPPIATAWGREQRCRFTFAGAGCSLPGGMARLHQTGTVTAINGFRMTIEGVRAPTSPPDRYFERGYAELRGSFVLIHAWDPSAPTAFVMNRHPPATWLGQRVTVAPGCDKTIETCRSRWNNEQHFGGFGFSLPIPAPLL